MRQEAFESGYGWLGLRDFVVCVQSYEKDSPSSGLFRVKVYNEHGTAQRTGTCMVPGEGRIPPKACGLLSHCRDMGGTGILLGS